MIIHITYVSDVVEDEVFEVSGGDFVEVSIDGVRTPGGPPFVSISTSGRLWRNGNEVALVTVEKKA